MTQYFLCLCFLALLFPARQPPEVLSNQKLSEITGGELTIECGHLHGQCTSNPQTGEIVCTNCEYRFP